MRGLLALLFVASMVASTGLSAFHVHGPVSDSALTTGHDFAPNTDHLPTSVQSSELPRPSDRDTDPETPDCRLCELNRRGDGEVAILVAPFNALSNSSDLDEEIPEFGAIPRALNPGPNSPRAPPNYSV